MDLSLFHNTASPSAIHRGVSLADKTWFRVGGSAQFYSEPDCVESFAESLIFANSHNLPIFVLGEGANILISDVGFEGLVIRPKLSTITHYLDGECGYVTAGAGTSFGAVIEYCLDVGLGGLEEFSGIPGTVGGSVYINIHYFEFLLSQFLVSARVLCKKTGSIETVENSWFEFGYNKSRLQVHDYFLVSATFKLTQKTACEISYARGRRFEMMRYRARRYPTSGTCGSFFRNFTEQEVAHVGAKPVPYVAYYLDKVGVKGELAVGGARVSHQHANMIVNTGNATATDIAELARLMQTRVFDTFGIVPQPECLLIGFNEYPLLRSS